MKGFNDKDYNFPFLRKKSESGVILILLLSLFPLLLTIVIGMAVYFKFLKEIIQTRFICRSELLEAQEKVGESIQSLLLLNQKVEALRNYRKVLNVSIASATASLQPGVVAQLVKIRQSLILSQKALRADQLSLIYKARWQLIRSQKKIVTKISGARIATWPKIAVKPKVPGEEFPLYEIEEPFIEKQNQKIFWDILFVNEERELLPWKKIRKKESCGVSLKYLKKEQKFLPFLTEGKFL